MNRPAASRVYADFMRHGLLRREAQPDRLHRLITLAVPSGRPVLKFEQAGRRVSQGAR